MKKRLSVLLGVAVMALLVIRVLTAHVAGVKEERQWYVKQLHYDGSGVIDSATESHLFFHVTHGTIDPQVEARMATALKYNGILELLLPAANDQINMMIDSAWLCRKGDSLHLNSNENRVRVFRAGELVKTQNLVQSLRGRPF